jgi:hypothetical protein
MTQKIQKEDFDLINSRSAKERAETLDWYEDVLVSQSKKHHKFGDIRPKDGFRFVQYREYWIAPDKWQERYDKAKQKSLVYSRMDAAEKRARRQMRELNKAKKTLDSSEELPIGTDIAE